MTSIMPTGLLNIGNTCFANSVIQWLLQTPEMKSLITNFGKQKSQEFDEKLDLKNSPEQLPDGRGKRQRRAVASNLSLKYPQFCCSLCGLKTIIAEMNSQADSAALPLGLKDIISKVFGEEDFFGHQQDAHEFLVMLLHSLENSECLKNSKQNSNTDDFCFDISENSCPELNEVFEGSFTSRIKWQKCKAHTETQQSFQDISLVSLHSYYSLVYKP